MIKLILLFYPDKKKKLQAEPQNARLQRTKTCFFFVSRILQMNSLEIILKKQSTGGGKTPASLIRASESAGEICIIFTNSAKEASQVCK